MNFIFGRMIRKMVVFLCFSSVMFGSYLEIKEPQDCSRVSGNMQIFWKTNQMLITPLKNNEDLTEEHKQHLLKSSNGIVKGILQELCMNDKILAASIEYTAQNKDLIEKEFGKITVSNLLGGLKALERLVSKLTQL